MTTQVIKRGNNKQNSLHPAVTGLAIAGLAAWTAHTIAPNFNILSFQDSAKHTTAPVAPSPYIKPLPVFTIVPAAPKSTQPALVATHRIMVKPAKPKTAAELSLENTRRIEDQVANQYRLCIEASRPDSDLKKLYAENGNRPLCGG